MNPYFYSLFFENMIKIRAFYCRHPFMSLGAIDPNGEEFVDQLRISDSENGPCSVGVLKSGCTAG
jgi:hypothetical protein